MRQTTDRTGSSRTPPSGRRTRGWLLVAATLGTALGCGDSGTGPTLAIFDRDRHARFSADEQTIVYYRNDERPGAAVGIYRVDVSSGDATLLVQAVLAGLDLHPQTDSIVFSARATGSAEPGLWIMGLDGGGVRAVGGGGSGPGYRWPAFSPDGAHLAWEVRYQDETGLDTVRTLWIGDWQSGAITNPRVIAPGRRSAWRPDGAALAVERRRPGGALPMVIAVVDTAGQLLDTLGFGEEPAWQPDGATVAYLAESQPDRGCQGVCFVPAGGGTPAPLSAAFVSYPGSWSGNGERYVFARLMGRYEIAGSPTLIVEESRLWIRTLATGADQQLTH